MMGNGLGRIQRWFNGGNLDEMVEFGEREMVREEVMKSFWNFDDLDCNGWFKMMSGKWKKGIWWFDGFDFERKIENDGICWWLDVTREKARSEHWFRMEKPRGGCLNEQSVSIQMEQYRYKEQFWVLYRYKELGLDTMMNDLCIDTRWPVSILSIGTEWKVSIQRA